MKTRLSFLLVSLFLVFFGTLTASAASLPDDLGIRKIDRVEAYSSNIYTLKMLSGEKAKLILNGDSYTDLDVYVYDTFGNLIVFDDGSTDHASVAWRCTLSSTFTIVVTNRGRVYNNFVLTID